jgi:hypothetical protein
MFKVVWVARFKPGMSREAASAHWTDVHGQLGLKLDGLTGYVQNHVRGAVGTTGIADGEVAFDGYSCEWWADRATFDRGLRSPEWAAVVEDGFNVFDMDSLDGMSAVLEERVIREGPRGPFKIAGFAKWLPHLSRDEASRLWLDHGEIALGVPGIDRYVQNLVVGAIDADGVTDGATAFDGFSELWFADADAYASAVASPAWADLVADGANVMDMDALEAGMGGVLEERVILEPAG